MRTRPTLKTNFQNAERRRTCNKFKMKLFLDKKMRCFFIQVYEDDRPGKDDRHHLILKDCNITLDYYNIAGL